ncbi:MAG: excinuclease ABC subunit UvrB [Candidatus Harrisonbacteria bacterium]|nr:excinuclease ABC subunit UvrB [Candidatus Harrisonbacteria bacterium]
MFKLVSNFKPTGDQPKAIESLVNGIQSGIKDQVLLGVTGSGKTFTMASVIEKLNLPTLIISPNKILAAQLYQEFKQFFPNNAVHYFVSYYDYYQPEAYLPHTNIYIQKDARINKEIDKLRHAAIQSVLSRKDTLVIASVSCIYGVGDPSEYQRIRLELKVGQVIGMADLARHFNFLQYERTTREPDQGQFKILKDKVVINSVTGELFTVEFRNKKIIQILGTNFTPVESIAIYPAKFWVTPQQKLKLALQNIKTEMEERVEELQSANKFEEADRIEKRTLFDLEMLKKNGYVNGIENYSRHLAFRQPGEPPSTLLDYFPKPFLLFTDESHIAVPQLNAMQEGDRRRKTTLVDYGFRLPSALDNRPLKFNEFNSRIGQTIYVSATPGPYELEKAGENIAEQLVRPTGILDPEIEIRPVETQVIDLLKEIERRIDLDERVLALTLTKRSAEDLTEFLLNKGIKAHYLHSEIKTLKRPEILNDLRKGKVDVIVGVNLLREGLDLPEVSLMAILNADREGFLRNYRGLIQMAGRAARSINGKVILYADKITDSIKKAIIETERRRKIQKKYNEKLGREPFAIKKAITESDLTRLANIQTKS